MRQAELVLEKNKMISFQGYEIDPRKVVGIGPIKSIHIGSMACDWTYGFDIFMQGNTIEVKLPLPQGYGYGGMTREDLKRDADKSRNSLLRLIECTV